MELICQNCKHKWDYQGNNPYYAYCSHCHYLVSIRKQHPELFPDKTLVDNGHKEKLTRSPQKMKDIGQIPDTNSLPIQDDNNGKKLEQPKQEQQIPLPVVEETKCELCGNIGVIPVEDKFVCVNCYPEYIQRNLNPIQYHNPFGQSNEG